MKISKRRVMILIITLCACQWLAIFKTGKFIYKADLINLTTIAFSLLFLTFMSFKPALQKKWAGKYRIWVIGSIVLWFIECVNSTFNYMQYGQGFMSAVSASFGSLVVISLFPLCYLQEKIRDEDYLKKTLKILGFWAALFSIVQVFLYTYNIILFDISGASNRYGTLRFGIAGYMVSIALLITFFDWINNRRKEDLIAFVVETTFLFYAQKTRTEIMYILLAIYFVAVLFLKNQNFKILLIFIGVIGLIVAVSSGFIDSYVSELGADAGVNMRFETIKYYMEQFYQHPILGMGYIKTNTSNPILYGLLYGRGQYAGYFYRDDVGIIGVINEKGICGLIWYCSLLLLMLKQTIALYKDNKRENVWLLSIWIYLAICSINIIWVNNLRMATLMCVVAMVQHYYCRMMRMKKHNG